MDRKPNVPTQSEKLLTFGRRMVQSELFIISSVMIIFVLLFFAPTLVKGKLPISSSYISNLYPWAYYGLPQAGEVSNNILSDQFDGTIPMAQFFLTELHRDGYPLWNPYVNSGVPFGLLFISYNFSIYRPATMLAGAKWGIIIYMFVKMYLVGILFYLYLRYRKYSWQAALSGSLVLMFSANMIVNAQRSVPDSIVYAPAILYFAERFVRERKYQYYIGVVCFTGVTIISGFPSVTMYTLIFTGVYLSYRILIELHDQAPRERVRDLFLVYSALGIGIIWTAFTLLPTYEYIQEVNVGYREGRGLVRLPLITMGRLLNPNMCGNPIDGTWFCPTNYNESAIYFGVLPIFLIPFSLANKKNRLTSFFFFISAVLLLMIIYGIGPLNKIVGGLPLFNINSSARMIALLPFCFAFITTIGMDNLVEINHKGKYISLLYFLLLMIGVAYSFKTIPFAYAKGSENIQYFLKQELFTLLLLGSYSFVIMIILIFRKRILNPALIALIVLSIGSSIALLQGYQGASNSDNFYRETAATTLLESEMPNYERMVIIGRHFIPSMPLYYSINSLTGHSLASVEFKQNLDLISPGIYATNSTQPRFASSAIDLMSPLLDLYRVGYIITFPGDEPIWYETLADQKEYNYLYDLNKLTTFGQTITINRDGYAERFEIRPNISDIALLPAHIKISDEDQLAIEIDGPFVKQDNGWYAIDFPRLPLKKGQLIKIEITLDRDDLPQNSGVYSVKSNFYKDGALFIDGEEMAGDLAFKLTQFNSKISEKFNFVHSGDLNIYANRFVDNRIPVINKLRYSSQEACASTLSQIDPFHEAVVNDSKLNLPEYNSESIATIREYSANKIVIDANIKQTSSMVVLSDAYYPGWQATIDGTPAKIHRVDCAMRGVIVSPGSHTIVMSYQPLSFKIGLGISLTSLAGLILVGIIPAGRRFWERKQKGR